MSIELKKKRAISDNIFLDTNFWETKKIYIKLD